MDCSLPGFSVHGILQARILEWIAMPFSRGIFPTQRSNPCLLHLLHWQAGSLPLSPPGIYHKDIIFSYIECNRNLHWLLKIYKLIYIELNRKILECFEKVVHESTFILRVILDCVLTTAWRVARYNKRWIKKLMQQSKKEVMLTCSRQAEGSSWGQTSIGTPDIF